jgi:hypothetical protein
MKESPSGLAPLASRLPLIGNDRPAHFDDPQADRRPDCLLALLFDLVHVEIAHLPRVALHDWFRQVGLVLDLLPTEEKRRVWGELVADRIVQQFPKYSGGVAACRQHIGCMRQHGRGWWEAWKREHAPPPSPSPVTGEGAGRGPSESEP